MNEKMKRYKRNFLVNITDLIKYICLEDNTNDHSNNIKCLHVSINPALTKVEEINAVYTLSA